MNKVKLGIFGPSGKMGQNIISQLEKFDNDLLLSSLCEQKNHEAIGKKIRGKCKFRHRKNFSEIRASEPESKL